MLAMPLLCGIALAQDLADIHPRHGFWDTTNKALFLSHAGLESVDFGITHRNLSNGGQEMDSMARALCQSGTAGQAVFFGEEWRGCWRSVISCTAPGITASNGCFPSMPAAIQRTD